MDNMNYLKYGGKVEDYLVEVLRDAKNKEQINLNKKVDELELLRNGVYKIERRPYRCETKEEVESLFNLMNSYNESTRGVAPINEVNFLESLKDLGFEIINYPYITHFTYLGKQWVVYYNGEESFKIRELDYKNIFLSKVEAKERLLELVEEKLAKGE